MRKRVGLILVLISFALVGSASAKVSSMGIAYQSPGSITFSVGVTDKNAPNLEVTSFCTDFNGDETYRSTLPVSGWFSNEGGLTGFSGAFNPPTGSACVAYVHRSSNDNRLVQVSYTAP